MNLFIVLFILPGGTIRSSLWSYVGSDIYVETRGLCRNEHNQFDDIFTIKRDLINNGKRIKLSECKNKCDSLDGCKAVSCEPTGCNTCYGTSRKASTTLEGDWVCYSKSG
jgi:hypothetical protein